MLEKLARLGYATKGIIYIIIGFLAIQAAFTTGGKTTDSSGTLQTIAAQPFGQVLLVIVGVGLFGYALWRLVEAIFDPEHKKTDAKNIAARLGYFISGIIYGGLGWQATSLAVNVISSNGSSSASDKTATLLAQPFGRWLVGIVGAIIIGVGFYRIYRAYKIKFRNKLNLYELNQEQQNWAVQISRFGIAARGVVFTIIGFFLLQAANQYDPSKAKGLDGVLETLIRQPFGKFLLALVAIGLIAYGIYQEIQARYRRIPT